MDIERFREEVHTEFGTRMEHATPAHVRRFLCRIYSAIDKEEIGPNHFAIPREDASNYEQVVNEFFARVLDLPPDQAVVLLWMFAGEMFYARLGEQYTQDLSDLFTFEITE